jgi:hypothetical protein
MGDAFRRCDSSPSTAVVGLSADTQRRGAPWRARCTLLPGAAFTPSESEAHRGSVHRSLHAVHPCPASVSERQCRSTLGPAPTHTRPRLSRAPPSARSRVESTCSTARAHGTWPGVKPGHYRRDRVMWAARFSAGGRLSPRPCRGLDERTSGRPLPGPCSTSAMCLALARRGRRADPRARFALRRSDGAASRAERRDLRTRWMRSTPQRKGSSRIWLHATALSSPCVTPCPTRLPRRGARSFPEGVGNGSRMEARQGAMRNFFRCSLSSEAHRNPPSRHHPMRDPVNRPFAPRSGKRGWPSRILRLHEIAFRCSCGLGPACFRQASRRLMMRMDTRG